ncbi:MAG: HepT-like ribonuclease domain-containing protein [Cyanobacteriota bacterium]
MRNILAHDYFNIDAEEIYKICSSDLESLKQVLARIQAEM